MTMYQWSSKEHILKRIKGNQLLNFLKFPCFWVYSDYLLLEFFLVKDYLVMLESSQKTRLPKKKNITHKQIFKWAIIKSKFRNYRDDLIGW